MIVTLKILQAEYKDGFVYTKIGAPAAAVMPVDVKNVKELDAAVTSLLSQWQGHVNGWLHLPGNVEGRKIAGYDAYRQRAPREVRLAA